MIMTSSFDEAVRLLDKWKTDSALVMVAFFDGPPERPRTLAVRLTGSVAEISGSWVVVANESALCSLRLEISGADFAYIEPGDRRLAIADADRERAEQYVESNLSLRWPDGNFCVFSLLREGEAFTRP